MKILSKSLLLVMISFISFSAGAQDSETRNLNSFDGVSVSSGISAELIKGNTNKIDISVEGIELEKVTTDIRKDVLKVGIEQSWWKSLGKRSKRKVEVVITYDGSLDLISASSGSSVWSDEAILSKELDLDASSGASLILELDVNDASLDMSSGSNVNLEGNAQKFEVDMSSGSNLNAEDLVSNYVDIDGSSGSVAKINVAETLVADVSSGASVRYKGDPKKTDLDKSSGGSVRKSGSM